MKTFQFAWNGRFKFIDADSEQEAIRIFQEKFGFYPLPHTAIRELFPDE